MESTSSDASTNGAGEQNDGEGKIEGLGYEHTLMYGSYTEELSVFARNLPRTVKTLRKPQWSEQIGWLKNVKRSSEALSNVLEIIWRKTLGRFGDEWELMYLGSLGVIMATISFLMDWGIEVCLEARYSLYRILENYVGCQYLTWIAMSISLVLFSSVLVHVVAPQAIGSGIPEMKTILRGVILKDYLSFRTLFAKVIGLVASLGSGMPLGKEGPFVHIASIVATLLAKLGIFKSIKENQSRGMEMLAAACAVGVACCFAAPIGGVLMSIEVTSVYFAVRNYWRGFFAATCGATFFRLFAVWFQGHDTLTAVYKTYLGGEFPYDPMELMIFCSIGVISGLIGACFVFLHRQYVVWMRNNKKLNSFLRTNRFIYPVLVSWLIASASFPMGFGQFPAEDFSTHNQVLHFFGNVSWIKQNFTPIGSDLMQHWNNSPTGVFVNLGIYAITTFFLSILASTLPVPSGNFVPVFKMGAALGRLAGELMQYFFPGGLKFFNESWDIVPGAYAVVGAAALSGAVTRTFSVCVIVAEMTGQLTYIIPIMLAVLISNIVAGLLQPSIFDSIAIIKRLPYLPDFIPSGTSYNILAKDFMVGNVHYIWHGMTFKELKDILSSQSSFVAFPLVENKETKILLGSVERHSLLKVIEKHIGRDRKKHLAIPNFAFENGHFRSEAAITQNPGRFDVSPVDVNHGVIEEKGAKRPVKSILKKTQSFHEENFDMDDTACPTSYQTVIGVESEDRKTVRSLFKRASTIFSDDSSLHLSKKNVRLPFERVVDLPVDEQVAWEVAEMNKPVDFSRCPVDPLPLNLVGQTSLLKVHSLFSLLRINRAYVTEAGRLIGVVAMKELRLAIEQCNAGGFSHTSGGAQG